MSTSPQGLEIFGSFDEWVKEISAENNKLKADSQTLNAEQREKKQLLQKHLIPFISYQYNIQIADRDKSETKGILCALVHDIVRAYQNFYSTRTIGKLEDAPGYKIVAGIQCDEGFFPEFSWKHFLLAFFFLLLLAGIVFFFTRLYYNLPPFD